MANVGNTVLCFIIALQISSVIMLHSLTPVCDSYDPQSSSFTIYALTL